MTDTDRAHLKAWCRHLEIDDRDDDGVATIDATFRIRDGKDETERLFSEMTNRDAAEILGGIVDELGIACDDYFDDWADGDGAFAVSFDKQDGAIVMSGTFRT